MAIRLIFLKVHSFMALFGLAKKLFGSSNERRIKPLWRRVEAINALEGDVARLTDAEIIERTEKLKARVADGESLDAVREDAFATVREAAKRALGQRHYDVQLLGGMILHDGAIAEMKTGEGKTLSLLKRMSRWMREIERFTSGSACTPGAIWRSRSPIATTNCRAGSIT